MGEPTKGATLTEPKTQRRRYDSPVRRERVAETRARIVASGTELLHGFPIWNWRALTVRAVAERAGVTERTVYRYFPSERDLRDAVMAELEAEAGVDIDGLALGDLREMTERIFRYVSSFPLEARMERDPTMASANQRQRDALVNAVAPLTDDWSEDDRTIAAAMLDVLWSVVAYERLVADWDLEPSRAVTGITWVMGLVERAIEEGRRPDA